MNAPADETVATVGKLAALDKHSGVLSASTLGLLPLLAFMLWTQIENVATAQEKQAAVVAAAAQAVSLQQARADAIEARVIRAETEAKETRAELRRDLEKLSDKIDTVLERLPERKR